MRKANDQDAGMAMIDEPTIKSVVFRFYARVRKDPMLNEIFNAQVRDWEFHLQRMCEFWSSIILGHGRYKGHPFLKHVTLPADARHFDRWLELFAVTVRETCTPAAAELMLKRATLIARSLEGGIANAHGVVLGRDQRFEPDRL